MKFIWNPRIFNDDILSSNICIPLFIEERKKKKKKQKNKHTKELLRTRNLSISSLAFYHCTEVHVEELLPKESS